MIREKKYENENCCVEDAIQLTEQKECGGEGETSQVRRRREEDVLFSISVRGCQLSPEDRPYLPPNPLLKKNNREIRNNARQHKIQGHKISVPIY